MARRDRYRQLVWLQRFSDDPEEGKMITVNASRGSIYDNLCFLTGELNLWVEVEQDGKSHKVRCYPRTMTGDFRGPKVCASYMGHRLYALFEAAVRDYGKYLEAPHLATLSPYEAGRWVA